MAAILISSTDTLSISRRATLMLLSPFLLNSVAAAQTPGSAAAPESVITFAMHWFIEMQAGRIDRPQYAPAYAAQLSDDSVKAMSGLLNKFGAAPLHAEIVLTRKDGQQTFYEVKFVFPRGDATSILFGFDQTGKITGVAVGGVAGD